jgi:hypothetical protein
VHRLNVHFPIFQVCSHSSLCCNRRNLLSKAWASHKATIMIDKIMSLPYHSELLQRTTNWNNTTLVQIPPTQWTRSFASLTVSSSRKPAHDDPTAGLGKLAHTCFGRSLLANCFSSQSAFAAAPQLLYNLIARSRNLSHLPLGSSLLRKSLARRSFERASNNLHR